jgi:hypothetical protein
MNKQDVLTTPDESRIEELLEKIQPMPSERFHQKIKGAIWQVKEGKLAITRRFHMKIAFAIIILASLTTLFVTPQGRAWAQEIFQFFRRVNFTTIPISEEEKKWMDVQFEQYELPLVEILAPTVSPDLAALPECQSSQGGQSYSCQIAYAESKLGFDLKELPVQPEGWEVDFLNFNMTSQTAVIGYKMDVSYRSYGQLLLVQSLGSNLDMYLNSPVPTDKVETVKVGSYYGEYVKGCFNSSSDGKELIWDDSDLSQRLAWSDGTQWYLIEFWGNSNISNSISRDQLIKLAADLVNKPIKKVEPLDPEFLYSISDAEKLSGLDLKAPTLLPLGIEFSSARYFSLNDEVHLRYGMNEELVIYEWKGKSINFDAVSSTSNKDYEIVEVNGEKAFYGSVEGADAHLFLWWEEDGLNYQMYHYQYFGGKLSKEKMIAIAESMSDINNFRGATFKPYDYVTIYEQSLGFDAKEFPTVPVGWSFTSVSAYAQPVCINISYTAEKESGWLFLNQCSTDMDKYFDLYNIPRNAMERVNIGKSKGQYIIGNSEVDDSGKLVWNSNLPFRILRWQEDGLWIQITLSGDSIVLYDKEDLISYAESLR